MEQNRYVITKRIAKQGNRSVICIPSLLQNALKPSTIVRVTIDIIGEVKNE